MKPKPIKIHITKYTVICHNNLEFRSFRIWNLKVLVQVPFTASKMELDIWYKKAYMQVSSRVASQLKIKDIGKY